VAVAAALAGLRAHGLAAALGVLAGLIGGEAAVAGWPALPPVGAIDKLPWLALGGAVLGALGPRLDLRWRRLALIGGLAATLGWIGWPRLIVPYADAWLAALLIGAGAWWALGRLERAGSAGGALLLVVGAVAAAGVAAYGASYAMAQVILVLAAALAGAMAGGGALGLGAAGRFAVAGPLVGLVAMLALYTRSDALALLLLLPVFLADGALEQIRGVPDLMQRAGRNAAAVRLGLVLALAAVPAAAAVAVAVWRSGPLYF
jgi:hypothetical protein